MEQLWVGGNDHIVNSNVFKYKVMIKITLNEAKRKLINRYKILMRRIKKNLLRRFKQDVKFRN